MENLTKKQKIIAGAIISIVVVVIGIYGYNMLQKEENWNQDTLLNNEDLQNELENLEGENITIENTDVASNIDNKAEEETNTNNSLIENSSKIHENLEGKIVIHITGAVQRTGILMLPEGARIADAIDASRRPY